MAVEAHALCKFALRMPSFFCCCCNSFSLYALVLEAYRNDVLFVFLINVYLNYKNQKSNDITLQNYRGLPHSNKHFQCISLAKFADSKCEPNPTHAQHVRVQVVPIFIQ